MSNPSRREKIERMLVDEPEDQFLRYSLALELEKEGEHDTSLERLKKLREDDPPYVPAFFMAAQQLVRLNSIDEACSLLQDGIEQAQRQEDLHAAAEMTEFLASLGATGE